MNIQWYPGHMKKTKELILENIKLVDIVVEIVDARIPLSSKNPDIENFTKSKKKIIIMNKIDLADEGLSKRWEKYFKSLGSEVIMINSINGKGIQNVIQVSRIVLKDKLERDIKRGIIFRPIKTMIVGIPNVGKSTFINKLVGKSTAKTGNKPGVTRGKQWIRIKKDFELLDTPGILWPKFEDELIGLKLAFIGSINDDIIDMQELAFKFIDYIKEYQKGILEKRYGIQDLETKETIDILKEIGEKRKYLLKAGEIDLLRTSDMIIDEFRSGKLGKITLEKPEHLEQNIENGEDV